MPDRVDQPEQFPGALAITSRGERHHGPYGGVGVLPAIFAHAGDVALDVAGVQSRMVKGRIEELYHADVALHESFVERLERLK